jgi:hypothetical protein
LAEDPTVNRMADSLVLFEQMANHKLLTKTPFVLFLNKKVLALRSSSKDLFKKKIKIKSLTITFPDYSGWKDVI